MTCTVAVCTVENSWWWTEELSETCRISFQNKNSVKLVHLVGSVIRNWARYTATWTSDFIICLFPLFYRKNGEKIIRISREKWLDVYGKVKRNVCRAFFYFNWADYLNEVSSYCTWAGCFDTGIKCCWMLFMSFILYFC
jgi:hypothetical protein